MAYVFITPTWFFTYSIILEVLFTIITGMVSMYSFKIYRLTEERQARIFGFAFLFIALSYLAEAVLNFILLFKFDDAVSTLIQLKNVFLLNLFGIYAHALFFIIGIIILTYVTLKVKSPRVLSLLLSLILVTAIFTTNKVFMFYMLSTVLLIHTVIYYFAHYNQNKNKNTLLVLIAMIFLLFSSFHFVLATNSQVYYVIGHILELIAYVLLLSNLLIILKNDKKKR
jgi:hypothetical protein